MYSHVKRSYRFDAEFMLYTVTLYQEKSDWKIFPALIFMTQGAWLSTELSSQGLIFHCYTYCVHRETAQTQQLFSPFQKVY